MLRSLLAPLKSLSVILPDAAALVVQGAKHRLCFLMLGPVLCGFLTPGEHLRVILSDAFAILISQGKAVLCVSAAIFGGLRVPAHSLGVILPNAVRSPLAGLVLGGNNPLRLGVIEVCGRSVPLDGLGDVLLAVLGAKAVLVHPGKVSLCLRILLLCRLTVPAERLKEIGLNTLTGLVEPCDIPLGNRISLVRGLLVPAERLRGIILCTDAMLEHPAEIPLGHRIVVLIGSSAIPLQGLLEVFLRAAPFLIHLGKISFGLDLTQLGGELRLPEGDPVKILTGLFNVRLPVFSLLGHGSGYRG